MDNQRHGLQDARTRRRFAHYWSGIVRGWRGWCSYRYGCWGGDDPYGRQSHHCQPYWQGRTPQEACEEAIKRVIRKNGEEKAKELSVAFLALSKDGELGAYSTVNEFS
jgi:hypothetical protein